jgi:subtilisin family serine protease
MKLRSAVLGLAIAALAACEAPNAPDATTAPSLATRETGAAALNVLLNQAPSAAMLSQLETYGAIADVITEINAVILRGKLENLDAIRSLPYVAAANADAERHGSPIDPIAATNFAAGLVPWNLDAINVGTNPAPRTLGATGAGVYVGVLDTGLLDSWRQYFPEQRIATQFAKAFGGSPFDNVSEQPNKWEHDQHSHGTHVTSIILGYAVGATPINGVAPNATVIPVKVLNQNGSGWSSVIARGIVHVTDLKRGPLAASPVVINMSLGGSVLDGVEKAAVDYAIANGVVVVASAGNEGTDGMGYPGAYEPVISVASAGWKNEWVCQGGNWWLTCPVADPFNPADYYISDFSSRELPGQDLDVAAPGSWVVGPWQLNSGKPNWFFIGGTSQAAPHVAGIAALILQTKTELTQRGIERCIVGTAHAMPAGALTVNDGNGNLVAVSWGVDATGAGMVDAAAAVAAANSAAGCTE